LKIATTQTGRVKVNKSPWIKGTKLEIYVDFSAHHRKYNIYTGHLPDYHLLIYHSDSLALLATMRGLIEIVSKSHPGVF
jgi:hypothetical protein